MASLIADLAKIREMGGHAPMPDPRFITEDGHTPIPYVPPPADPDVPAEWLDPELDVPEVPPSPLIPRRPTPPVSTPSEPSPPQMIGPRPSLAVLDRAAAYKGREVQLTDRDEAAVRSIVLKAIQREVTAELEAVTPRRKRRVAEGRNLAVGITEVAPKVPKRGPGRPKKVK